MSNSNIRFNQSTSANQGDYSLVITAPYLYPYEPFYLYPTASRMMGNIFSFTVEIMPLSGAVPQAGDTITIAFPNDIFSSQEMISPDFQGTPLFSYAYNDKEATGTLTILQTFSESQTVTFNMQIADPIPDAYFISFNTATITIHFDTGNQAYDFYLKISRSEQLCDFLFRSYTPANQQPVGLKYNMFIYDYTTGTDVPYPLGETNPTLFDADRDGFIDIPGMGPGVYSFTPYSHIWGLSFNDEPFARFVIDIGGGFQYVGGTHCGYFGGYWNFKWTPTGVFTILKQNQDGQPLSGAGFTLSNADTKDIYGVSGLTGADGYVKDSQGNTQYFWVDFKNILVEETTFPPGSDQSPVAFIITNSGYETLTMTTVSGNVSMDSSNDFLDSVEVAEETIFSPPGIQISATGCLNFYVVTAPNNIQEENSSLIFFKTTPDGQPLDASFELYAGSWPGTSQPEGEPLLQFTTSGGSCTIENVLTPGQVYTLYESQVPSGYQQAENLIFTASLPTPPLSLVNDPVAEKIPFEVLKRSCCDEPLKATFALYPGTLKSRRLPDIAPLLVFETRNGRYISPDILDKDAVYTLVELHAPDGYELLEPVVFTANESPVRLRLTNHLKSRCCNTGCCSKCCCCRRCKGYCR